MGKSKKIATMSSDLQEASKAKKNGHSSTSENGTNKHEDVDATAIQSENLARICHDMNNPLAVISGNAQLLKELIELLEVNSELKEPVKDICDASHRLQACIEELDALRGEEQ